jgi:hypothetical protein
MQVLQLTPEQIAALPPDQQAQVLQLVFLFNLFIHFFVDIKNGSRNSFIQ